MTEDEAYRRLRTLLVQIDAESVVLGDTAAPLTDIIHSHQTAPRPDGAHAVLTPLGSRDTGEGFRTCYENVTIAGELRVVELRTEGVEYGFRIDVFAHRAPDNARAFKTALLSARAQLDLLPFVVRDVGAVESQPGIVEQHWEGRARLTVNLGAARTQRTLIEVIEAGHIDFAGSGARSVPITTTVDFPKE